MKYFVFMMVLNAFYLENVLFWTCLAKKWNFTWILMLILLYLVSNI